MGKKQLFIEKKEKQSGTRWRLMGRRAPRQFLVLMKMKTCSLHLRFTAGKKRLCLRKEERQGACHYVALIHRTVIIAAKEERDRVRLYHCLVVLQ